ncbi:NAD(P)H-hydrate dehydratase [Dactylosporangium matsuzakiense]|uniref:Bifunctional NAD(P)H-hydrate repair enzyme n=1 Tax=Dactylosporangium matsuzakiense TaxID=53360 RepID=A0A9W6NJR4_9ACTN|nr:NAD(P)H-hydrate dehydratase [Dactylosporangium matsuzakiense]UWZ44302.1 NAD(P)H-hydrate dehydratase [Dactylosporangium matsuzakiense]GLK99548.1 bifunctional NAD(P)H-hydrate repair enzyme [Dactylosporangium matsuzakiense]
MRTAWRVAQVRAAEESVMKTLPGGALMQRAAAGLARRIADTLPRVYGSRVLLLVGPGNNGADALYAGARLAARGARVDALVFSPDRVHRAAAEALYRAGGRLDDDAPGPSAGRADVVVDGILGIGGQGGLREPIAARVADLADVLHRAPVIAVDVPSGVDADTGAVTGMAVHADITVTFGALKPGLLVGAGAVHAGILELIDIGLEDHLDGDPALYVPDAADIAGWWPRPRATDNKYSRGVVGVATGSDKYPGAAVLSTAGALAGPAGLVRYAGSAAHVVRYHHPPVIATEKVSDAGRVQAWVCGSGLGTDERGYGELRAVLGAPVPAILDADALTLLADARLADWMRERDAPTVVTPHDGEFQRMFGGAPGDDRIGAAKALAERIDATVLLKGDRTIVATPDGRVFVNPTGTAALATGGSGDVLAGLLGALLAGGLQAEHAAVAAAYVHGLAGRRAADSGPVTATDVAAHLREAVRTLTRR